MKIVTTKTFLVTFAIVLFALLGTFAECASMEAVSSFKSNFRMEKSKKIKKAQGQLVSPPLYEAWVKYFKFPKNSGEIPPNFFKNPSYEKQLATSNKKPSTEASTEVSFYFFIIII